MKKIYIGIDPAARASGNALCTFDPETKTFYCKTFATLASFIIYLNQKAGEKATFARCILVENSNLQTANFQKDKYAENNPALLFFRGAKIGKNQQAAQVVFDLCKALFINDITNQISPTNKGAKLKTQSALIDFFTPALGFIPSFAFIDKETQDCYDAIKLAFYAYILDTKQLTIKELCNINNLIL